MSALFGFTGLPDPALLAMMHRAVQHRGGVSETLDVKTGRLATLAVHPISTAPCPTSLAPGIHEWDGGHLAIAGELTRAPSFSVPPSSPSEIASAMKGSFVAAWMAPNNTLHLLRDGSGRRSLYLTKIGSRWAFSIEPKGLHALPQFPRNLRPAAIAQFLSFSFIPGKDTMFQGLWEVPAGHWVTLDPEDAEPSFQSYFLPERCSDEAPLLNDHEGVALFRRSFAQSVADLLHQDRPAAVFLSGGIDSSVVTAELAEQCPNKVHTFAIHFGKRYPNELEHARAVADFCQTRHEEVLVRPRDFLGRLRSIAWHLDEPIGDPVAMPNFILARHVAAQGFEGVFNGEGGDPLFGGPKNLPMLLGHWYGGDKDRFASGFRENAYLASYRRAYEELDFLLTPEVRREIDWDRDLAALLRPFFDAPHPTRFLDKLISINARLKGAHLILPKVERMLSASQLTPLSPLFDERMAELAYRLPGDQKLRRGMEKWALKEAFRGRVPDEIIARPKSGMRVPVHFWFQGELKRYAHRLLSKKRIEADGLFRSDRVRQILRYQTEEGPGRYGIRLWMLITFHLWWEQFGR
ncbi:MAG: asparagine synthase C-terminal domain-containing protein [Verrucomicrobiota bacterium]